jgi:hypothetical protein
MEKGARRSAGIDRHRAEDERALHEVIAKHHGPESCMCRREAAGEALTGGSAGFVGLVSSFQPILGGVG